MNLISEHISLFLEGILLQTACMPRLKMSGLAWLEWDIEWCANAEAAGWEDRV